MKIGVICSGGDSPGMNATILAIKQSEALSKDTEIVFFKNGYQGIYENWIISLEEKDIDISKAGTCIGTSRFEKMREAKTRKQVIENLKQEGIEGLIVIGGNGSLKGATLLKDESDLSVSVIAGTIDNDFPETEYTLGFDTALNTLIAAVDELTTTAQAHNRIILMEVMGRNCFALAEHGAVASFASLIESDEKEYLHNLCKKYENIFYSPIILLPEGLPNKQKTIEFLTKNLPKETKYINLSYLQRGASPTFYDRYMGHKWGSVAVSSLLENNYGILSQKDGKIILVPW
ncbi:ATP-dependent 6-phosphofructokinase [Enterococcus asini]|uniref:ATP-dependent 6-phosphofructokinase n=1 Tax=Enterococcus TaxID=1350 RepID=UPI00288FEBA1|nr:ATP-dependent 6-phosphofructokinase [Enterococcus asini]MDT2757157.1 ATP-dependent 6-phosphofructokinase [Enterococcus asini]